MAANLTPDDMRAVGAYYFSQRQKTLAVARDKVLADSGQKIYRAGVSARGVPACAGCHGGAGAGIPALYPRLAGQWPDYVLASLKAYSSGARKNPQMNAIAVRMTDNDMRAAAEYVAGMRAK
jgi:cytochrome c553